MRTLRRPTRGLVGVGVHSGTKAWVVLTPRSQAGIRFCGMDGELEDGVIGRAWWDSQGVGHGGDMTPDWQGVLLQRDKTPDWRDALQDGGCGDKTLDWQGAFRDGGHSNKIWQRALQDGVRGNKTRDIRVRRQKECDAPLDAVVGNVTQTQLRTVLGNRFYTVEHVLAALYACGIDACTVHVGGTSGEIPIMDGSALPFVQDIEHAGLCIVQNVATNYLLVKRPVTVEKSDGTRATLLPLDRSRNAPLKLNIGAHIDFEVNYRDSFEFSLNWADLEQTAKDFRKEIAPARTFAFEKDVPALLRAGMGLGGSLENSVIFSTKDPLVPLNPPLRFANEPVRHKVLDVIGDLSLCGMRLCGTYQVKKPGHGLNREVLVKLLSDANNFEVVSS